MIAAVLMLAGFGWLIVSCVLALLVPWSLLDTGERWMGWSLVLFWPVMIAWMLIELPLERRRSKR